MHTVTLVKEGKHMHNVKALSAQTCPQFFMKLAYDSDMKLQQNLK